MRVLVLGAGGFLGQRVVAALAGASQSTPIAAMRRLRPIANADSILLDATDPAALRSALDGVDSVVNCVAGSADAIRRGALALAEVAEGRRIVHLSSITVYGTATGVVAEDGALLGDLGSYGAAKVDAEIVLKPLNTVMLRPGCIHGPGSPVWTTAIARLLAAGRLGDLGAGGTGISNLVDVEDVVRAVLAALDLPGPGVFNLALPDSPSWNGYFAQFSAALGLPLRRIPGWRLWAEQWLAAPPLKLAAMAGVTNAPPLLSPSQLRLWRQDIRMDVRRAETGLGLTWTPLGETLARSVAALRFGGGR
jgi:nucleoside-diphosphate-sugar epimerase